MKHIILAAFVGLCLSSWAQDFPIPYNPDSDLNGLIGSPDLLSLLAVYGEEFSAAVVSEDNGSAIMFMGNMAYPLCAMSCRNLPGMWQIPALEDLGMVWVEVNANNTATWVRNDYGDSMNLYYTTPSDGGNFITNIQGTEVDLDHRCYCVINELPKVEWSVCRDQNHEGWEDCCEEKVAAGWLPLPGIALAKDGGAEPVFQAFWRWAE